MENTDIFGLRINSVSQNQSPGDTLALTNYFAEFLRNEAICNDFNCGIFSTAAKRIKNLFNETFVKIKWFSTYGCCIIILTNEDYSEMGENRTYHLHLLGLDTWTSGSHFSYSCIKQTAFCQNYKVLSIGAVEGDNRLKEVLVKFEELLSRSESNKGNNRSAFHSSTMGNQKTPSFIQALLRAAITGKEVTSSQGGFTDVGLHTGTLPRCTTWPLAKAVIRYLLEKYEASTQPPRLKHYESEILFCFFYLKETEKSLIHLSSPHDSGILTKGEIDKVMGKLTVAARAVSSLCQRDLQGLFSWLEFEKRFIAVKGGLSEILRNREKEANLTFAFPDERIFPDTNYSGSTAFEIPNNHIEETQVIRNGKPYGSCSIVKPKSLSLQGLQRWVSRKKSRKSSFIHQLIMNTIEQWFNSQALKLLCKYNEDLFESQTTAESISKLDTYSQMYKDIVFDYGEIASAVRAQASEARLASELRSRELLVIWTAYCCTHKLVTFLNPQLKNDLYGVPLDWTDLQHLVLSKKEYMDALCQLAGYLKRNTIPGKELFHLSRQEPSLRFAEKYARANSQYGELLSKERECFQKLKENHWDEVKEKQENCRILKNKIVKLENEMENETCLHYHLSRNNRIILNSLKSELNRTEKSPLSLFAPLPASDSLAFKVLFFLYIPGHLQNLAILSTLSQQMLLPSHFKFAVPSSESSLEDQLRKNAGYEWESYYSNPPGWSIPTWTVSSPLTLEAFKLFSSSTPPRKVGSPTVYTMEDPEDGVWYPDSLYPSLAWDGGDYHGFRPFFMSEYFDPFQVQGNDKNCTVALGFADPFSRSAESLNWIIPQLGYEKTQATRGNLSIAAQDSKFTWLNKVAFLELASLRAFPQQQFRKVCIALSNSEHSLPLHNKSVQSLLRQALYHIGELSSDDVPFPLWKADQLNGDGLEFLADVLDTLAERLSETPKDHEDLRIVIEIASYGSQWSDRSRSAARRLSDAACSWADEIDDRVATDLIQDRKVVESDREKQCLFQFYSLLGHECGELTGSDVTQMVSSILQTASIFTKFDGSKNQELIQLKLIGENIMSHRASEVLPIIDENPSILTVVVTKLIHSTPSTLAWTRVSTGSCSYRAESSDGHEYAVNVLTGMLLYDGLPLSRLTLEIREHPLFQRSFGEKDFEVRVSNRRRFETIRPVKGFYSFELLPDGRLEVIETPEGGSSEDSLSLLDISDPTSITSEHLPVRLRSLYSHWANHDKSVCVLRPLHYLEREVYFLLKKELLVWRMFRIGSFEALPWQELLGRVKAYDELKFVSSANNSVVETLTKLENSVFIHLLISPEDHIKYHIPRFDLEFIHEKTGGPLRSLNFPEKWLSPHQHLVGLLPGFTDYLVLTDSCPIQPSVKVLVHRGKLLVEGNGGRVYVERTDQPDARLSHYIYDLHPRFQTLTADSIASRLYLAAIHAACSSLLPLSGIEKTGHEIAICLVRQSWMDRPLSGEELQNLEMLVSFSICCPTLKLLCHELYQSSSSLSFLYPEEEALGPPSNLSDVYVSQTCYWDRKNSCNFNFSLAGSEESRLNGGTSTTEMNVVKRKIQRYVRIAEKETSIVEDVEAKLDAKVKVKDPISPDIPPFPLTQLQTEKQLQIARELFSRLEESWSVHHNLPSYQLEGTVEELDQYLTDIHRIITQHRISLEKHLLAGLAVTTEDDELYGAPVSNRLLQICNDTPTASAQDLCRLLVNPDVIPSLNPFLDDESISRVKNDCVLWLKMCVLEDKLVRLRRMCLSMIRDARKDQGSGATALLIRELQVTRVWEARDHPRWLLLEAEGMIQIRPLQYIFAEFLMNNPGAIAQLNMGEGKTRVILPMLMLHWADSDSKNIFRLLFLTQLLKEAHSYLHQHLTASVHEMKLSLMLFHRNIDLTKHNTYVMKRRLLQCVEDRGCVLLAPEHRLSFELKWYESKLMASPDEDLCVALRSVLDLPYDDVLDESDELMSFKYQLIYSTGSKMSLLGDASRYAVPSALLEVIHSSQEVRSVLDRTNVSLRESGSDLTSGESFSPVRVIPGVALENSVVNLNEAVLDALLLNPPFELRWLAEIPFNVKDHLKRFTVQTDYCLSLFSDVTGDKYPNGSKRLNDLLVLRAYLAHGLLWNALQKRHRVHYGIKRLNASKRIAVPYRAQDTPAERSDFGHPDMAIALTVLSYFYDGLSEGEVLEAFTTLLIQNPNTKKAIFNSWFQLSAESMAVGEERDSLNSVLKIDLSNRRQVVKLVNYFRLNRHVISFWLTRCVFPQDMKQYSSKLIANPWHLAQSTERIVGVSGTNDTKLIYPQQVEQRTIPHKRASELTATNGKMLSVLVGRNLQYYPLWPQITVDVEVLSLGGQILSLCRKLGTSVLLDAGAICSGMTNAMVARQMLDQYLDENQFQGVVFFDSEGARDWVVWNKQGNQWLLRSSPVKEKDCFVYIDEVHCRGTDMKLKIHAQGLLTLGIGMTKDKLMQAAARLRMLALGLQSIHLVGPEDVTAQIYHINGITPNAEKTALVPASDIRPEHILQWVMANTVQYIQQGLKEWVFQGTYFSTTRNNPGLARIKEVQELDVMYGPSALKTNLKGILSSLESLSDSTSSRTSSIIREETYQFIASRVGLYGYDYEVTTAQTDEECEREVEKEVEKEQEIERQLPSLRPRAETDWDVSQAFLVHDPSKIDSPALSIQSLGEFLTTKCNPQLKLSKIDWISAVDCYVTTNFSTAVEEGSAEGIWLEHYLRPVDALLYYPNSKAVLLLSEREADRALRLIWTEPVSDPTCVFLNLSFCLEPHPRSEEIRGSHKTLLHSQFPDSARVALALFNGQVSFPSKAMKSLLNQFLSDVSAQRAALNIPVFRGMQFLLPRSDLEEACVEGQEEEETL